MTPASASPSAEPPTPGPPTTGSAAAADRTIGDGAVGPDRIDHLARFLTGSVALLILLVAALALRSGWTPTSDEAWEVLRMHDVGTRDNPLVGVYSRFGFNHPGPALFWVGAIGRRLGGNSGVLTAIGMMNLVWFLAATRAARHLGGRGLAIGVTAASAAMIAAAGPVRLVAPWNPWATTFSTLCFVLCAFAFAERGVGWCAPVAVVAGSFAVQAHVGAAPVILVVLVVAAIWFLRVRPDIDRPLAVTATSATAAVLLWVGPLVQQLRGPDGNLAALLRFSREGAPGGSPKLGDALAAAATELGPFPAWMGFGESDRGFVAHSPAIGLVVVPLLLGFVAFISRRRHPLRVRLAVAGIAIHLVSVLAITRVTGGLFPYVIRWAWAPSAVAFVILGWALVTWGTERPASASTRGLAQAAIGTGAVAVVTIWTLVAVGSTAVTAVRRAPAPAPELGERAAALAAEMGPLLPSGPVGISWDYGEVLGAVPIGAIVEVLTDGADLRFDPRFVDAVGQRRTITPPGAPEVRLVPFYDRPSVPAGHRLLGSWDPLDADRRADYAALDRSLRTALDLELLDPMPAVAPSGPAPVPQRDLDRWHELREAGAGYGILLVEAAP